MKRPGTQIAKTKPQGEEQGISQYQSTTQKKEATYEKAQKPKWVVGTFKKSSEESMLEQEQTPRFSKDATPIDGMSNHRLWYKSNTDTFFV